MYLPDKYEPYINFLVGEQKDEIAQEIAEYLKSPYLAETQDYVRLMQQYDQLEESDRVEGIRLKKLAVGLYDRFSQIKYDVKHSETRRGEKAAEKDRLEEMLKIIKEVYIDLRVVSNRAVQDWGIDR